jgi:hypothetical protein
MEQRDTELLKIQAYIDFCNTEFSIGSSYSLGVIVAYVISVMVLYLQHSIDQTTYYVLLALGTIVFVPLVIYVYRIYSKRLSRVDKLIEKLNKGEPIPSIRDMIKEKTWKTEKDRKKEET